MLYEEAEWIGRELGKVISAGTIQQVLNIGSSTNESWTNIQQHVETFVFSEIRNSGIKLINADIKSGEGVDIVGDLNDDHLINKLSEMNFNLIICANLLEHVKDPVKIGLNVSKIVRPGNYAIVTVPHVYPYHPDPEDYLFRPGISELKKLFSTMEVIDASIITARRYTRHKGVQRFETNYFQHLIHNPRLLVITLLRIVTPFYKYSNWKKTVWYLPKMFRPFSVSCIVLKKPSHEGC